MTCGAYQRGEFPQREMGTPIVNAATKTPQRSQRGDEPFNAFVT